jgi:DNA-binding transcriptional ArsR family regulator
MRTGSRTRRAAGKGTPPDLDAITLAMQMLADGTRLRILLILAEGPMSVMEIQGRLGCPQPTVSHHLGLLKLVGWVNGRRAGKRVYYRLPRRSPPMGTVRIAAGRGTILVDARGH